jgi:hypothetical protein
MVRSAICASAQDYFDLRGFLFAQGQVVALDEIFNGIAQGRVSLDQDGFASDNSHFNEAPAQRAGAVDAGNGRPLAGLEEVELNGFGHNFLFKNTSLIEYTLVE